jgi:hypothetical protein
MKEGICMDTMNTNMCMIPNAETRAALEEYEEMKKHPDNYKRYSTFEELMDEVLEFLEKGMKVFLVKESIDDFECKQTDCDVMAFLL